MLVFEHTILKREGMRPPYCVVAVVPLRSHPYPDPSVECKNGVSVASALLVLEHNIKKDRAFDIY